MLCRCCSDLLWCSSPEHDRPLSLLAHLKAGRHVVMKNCCFDNNSNLGMAECLTQSQQLLFNVSDRQSSFHNLQRGSGFGLALCTFGTWMIVVIGDPKCILINSKSVERVKVQNGVVEGKFKGILLLGAVAASAARCSDNPSKSCSCRLTPSTNA